MAGFVVSLRYLYGCVVYMNNVEVFRNGVNNKTKQNVYVLPALFWGGPRLL